MSARINKSLVLNGTEVVSQAAWNEELNAKQEQLSAFLKAQGLAGVLLRRNENVAWITGGAVELRVLTPNESGVAALLVTAEGKRYYFTTNNEAARLHDEEFSKLDFEPVIFPWHADDTNAAAANLVNGPLGTDTAAPGQISVSLASLRSSLLDTEIARYQWLGQQVAIATTESLKKIEPGMTEFDLEAITSAALLRRGILPSVALYAVDERIYNYKHAVPRGAKLKSYAMLNLCARRFGMAISITRFAHFGAMPADLAAKFEASAKVNAALLAATKVGATSAQLFAVAKDAYAAVGYAGDEQAHHQGGPTGYWEREWVATPNGTEVVVNKQAFAWNPSIRGGKAEDTVLLRDGKIEYLTATPELPVLEASVNGTAYKSAGVLVR